MNFSLKYKQNNITVVVLNYFLIEEYQTRGNKINVGLRDLKGNYLVLERREEQKLIIPLLKDFGIEKTKQKESMKLSRKEKKNKYIKRNFRINFVGTMLVLGI